MGSEGGGAPQYLYVVLPMLLLAFCVWLRPCMAGAHSRGEDAYTALLSPTVRRARNALERRVALAVREASLGSRECPACSFTNSVRVRSCVLCGTTIEPKRSLFRVNDRAQSATLTAQQRRVRRRREWLRVIALDGSLVWHFDHNLCEIELRYSPHCVLQIARSEDQLPRHERPDLEEVVVESPGSLAHAARELKNELGCYTMTVCEVVDGCSIQGPIAFQPREEDNQRATRNVLLGALDFPSKLAHFVKLVAELFDEAAPQEVGSDVRSVARLRIDRSRLLVDSIAALSMLSPVQTRGPLRVEFVGELAIDAGGVYREWFLLLNAAIIEPTAGVFVCVDRKNQAYSLNPHAHEVIGDDYLVHFQAAGRLLGRALLDGNVTGFHLSQPLLKLILGLPIGLHDLEFVDPVIYNSLRWIQENHDVDSLGLNFTVVEKLPNESTRVVELMEGGSNVEVNDDNKREFVHRKFRYLLFDRVQSQLLPFLKGVFEVIPADLVALFDSEELDYMLAGSDEIDVDDWESQTVTSPNLIGHLATEYFWEVVRELTHRERQRLLQFATGSRRVPPGGFATLTSNDGQLCLFTLKGVPPETTRGYLHSHACFNTVDLPMHGYLKDMRTAVRAALDNESVGFTTH